MQARSTNNVISPHFTSPHLMRQATGLSRRASGSNRVGGGWDSMHATSRMSRGPLTDMAEASTGGPGSDAVPWNPSPLRQRQETRVDFETNARSDQAQA